MSTEITTRPRDGWRHGDVSYIRLGLPDLDRGRALLPRRPRLAPQCGSSQHGAPVEDIFPMIGLSDGEGPAGGPRHGAVLGFRVDDITAAVTAVRAHGGTISDPHGEVYAIAAEGHDDQGIPFYLHQMPPVPGDNSPAKRDFPNGELHGDVSHGDFAWTFDIGRSGTAQVTGVAPRIGMAARPETGPATPGVILCYRADYIVATVQGVREAGGEACEPEQRPYGLESL